MISLKLGCQTYTWEMLGDNWTGTPDDLLEAIAAAGYAGIEITDRMIGRYATDAKGFSASLAAHGLTLVSLAIGSPTGFTVRDRSEDDLDNIRRWIDFAASFTGALISLGSATSVANGPADEKFAVAADIYNRAAESGAEAAVTVAFHPSSHHDTLLFDRADYGRIFALLDADLVGWVPDTGHILRGGMDILDTLSTYRDRIRTLHLKDVAAGGEWAMLGTGICDIASVVDIVAAAPRFNGWLVLEEESNAAAADPAAAVQTNYETMRGMGIEGL